MTCGRGSDAERVGVRLITTRVDDDYDDGGARCFWGIDEKWR